MSYKQTKMLLYIILALSLILIIYYSLLFAFSNKINNNSNTNNAQSVQSSPNSMQLPKTQSQNIIISDVLNSSSNASSKFMLKSKDNRVYVYTMHADGSLEELNEININPKYMRELDRKSLNKGIVVNSDEELLCLIEDFSS